MEGVMCRNDNHLVYCGNHNSNNTNNINNNNNESLSEYLGLDNRGNDPLRQPEVTVNLNEGSSLVTLQPMEELEEDIFDEYEPDIVTHDGNTDSEEQVVPSSQLSSTHKYPEELTISDDEIDEGIFEDDQTYDLTDNGNRHDSQPP